MTSSSSTIESEEKLQLFMGKVLSDFGGAASLILAYIGDKLGLYKAMHGFGKPINSEELATFTGTSERYIREWLANQAAGGYLTYDASSHKYILPTEHAQTLINEDSPTYFAGGFQVMMSLCRDEAKFLDVSHGEIMKGTERFFKPVYTANLVSSWIPALDNGKVEEKLKKQHLKVADVGCGH